MSARRPGRMLAIAASVAMAAAVVAGLWMMGSPAHQRALRLDARRVTNLRTLTISIQRYWRVHQALPADLAAVDPKRMSSADPLTGKPYAYEKTGTDTYRLCAHFQAASPDRDEARSRYVAVTAYSLEWQHPKGRHCFDQRVTPSR